MSQPCVADGGWTGFMRDVSECLVPIRIEKAYCNRLDIDSVWLEVIERYIRDEAQIRLVLFCFVAHCNVWKKGKKEGENMGDVCV